METILHIINVHKQTHRLTYCLEGYRNYTLLQVVNMFYKIILCVHVTMFVRVNVHPFNDKRILNIYK